MNFAHLLASTTTTTNKCPTLSTVHQKLINVCWKTFAIGNDVKLMCTSGVHAMKKNYINHSENKNRAHVRILKAIFFCFLFMHMIHIDLFFSYVLFCFPFVFDPFMPSVWMRISYGNWFHEIADINFRFDYFICFLFSGRNSLCNAIHRISNGTKCVFSCIVIVFFSFFSFLCMCFSSFWCVCVCVCVYVDFMTYSRKVNIRIARCDMCAQTIA